MHKKLVSVMFAVIALLALFSCSTTNVGTLATPDKNSSAFKLSVSEGSYLYGASVAGYSVNVEDRGQDVVVSVNAEHATRLTALYFDLSYNPEQYRPMTVAPSTAIAPIDEMIELTYLKDRGVVHHGQIAMNPQSRTGFSGSGTVANVVFRKATTPPVRSVSTPPNGPESKTILTLTGGNTLDWHHYNNADYNQDGSVTVQDLTPIGINFSQNVTGAPNGALAVVDGNGDGKISVQDLTPIGINFQKRVNSYNVYSTEVPANYPDAGTLEGNVLQNTGTGSPARLAYQFVIAAPSATAVYWVRPADNGGTEGVPSDPVGNVGLHLTVSPTPSVGDGGATPFDVAPGESFTLTLTSDADGDVTLDPTTIFDSTDDTKGAITVGGTDVTLDIPAAATPGTFSVSGTYGLSVSLNFNVTGTIPSGGLFIQPAVADADWTGANGSGTSADPWILGTDTFNSTLEVDGLTRTLEFSWDAFEGSDNTGTALDESTLTWTGYYDWQFVFTDTSGTFKVHNFTSGTDTGPSYVQAQNVALDTSNKVYVEVQGVPAT